MLALEAELEALAVGGWETVYVSRCVDKLYVWHRECQQSITVPGSSSRVRLTVPGSSVPGSSGFVRNRPGFVRPICEPNRVRLAADEVFADHGARVRPR